MCGATIHYDLILFQNVCSVAMVQLQVLSSCCAVLSSNEMLRTLVLISVMFWHVMLLVMMSQTVQGSACLSMCSFLRGGFVPHSYTQQLLLSAQQHIIAWCCLLSCIKVAALCQSAGCLEGLHGFSAMHSGCILPTTHAAWRTLVDTPPPLKMESSMCSPAIEGCASSLLCDYSLVG
jgi:hypothetical protein